MLGPHWFFRMKRWVEHPPPPRRVLLVFAVIATCLLLYGLERSDLLPKWMAAERVNRVLPATVR